MVHIYMLTCLCNVDIITPYFYLVYLGFTGLYMYVFFVIFTLKHRLRVLVRTASIYVLRINKKISIELISKFNVGLKSLLHQGLLEPEFYGDLIYKFKKIRGMTDFSDQFRKIIMRNKRIGYNVNVMRQSACLVINPITVDSYAALFNCTPVDRASDSMMAPT